MEASEMIGKITEWLKVRKPELTEIDREMDLIESRVLDSLIFMEFLFFLESLIGRELHKDAASIEKFRTLKSIEENVLNAGA